MGARSFRRFVRENARHQVGGDTAARRGPRLDDLPDAFEIFDGLDWEGHALLWTPLSRNAIIRAIGRERMFIKLVRPRLLGDMKPRAAQAELTTNESTLSTQTRL